MTSQTVLDAIERHGLLGASEFERVANRWRKPGRPKVDDADALARWLVINHSITQFQADLLLEGRDDELEIGQYRVSDRAPEGIAQGCVQATDALGRPVIIQFDAETHRPGSPEVARFLELGKAACKVDDQGVWRALDSGVAAGRCYLVRESIRGDTLDRLLGRGKPPSPENLARMLAQVLQALHALHQAGLRAGEASLETLALVDRSSGGKSVKVVGQPSFPGSPEDTPGAETLAFADLFHGLMENNRPGKVETPEILAAVMADLVSPVVDHRPRDAAAAAKTLRVALAAIGDTRKPEPAQELEIVSLPGTRSSVQSVPAEAPAPDPEPDEDTLHWARPWLEKAGLSVRDVVCGACGALAMILLLLAGLFAMGDLVPILALGLGAAGGVWTERWIRERLAN